MLYGSKKKWPVANWMGHLLRGMLLKSPGMLWVAFRLLRRWFETTEFSATCSLNDRVEAGKHFYENAVIRPLDRKSQLPRSRGSKQFVRRVHPIHETDEANHHRHSLEERTSKVVLRRGPKSSRTLQECESPILRRVRNVMVQFLVMYRPHREPTFAKDRRANFGGP